MSDEEILAELDKWLNNSLFISSYRKLALQELMKRYTQSNLTIGRIRGIIKKQQKEIEEQKQNWKELLHEYGLKCEELNNSISKDKIREKLEEVSNGIYDAKGILEKLLKEN